MTARKRHLAVVDEDYMKKRRVYAVVVDEFDHADLVQTLESLGYIVINADEDRPADEVDLRVHLAALTVADAIALPSVWWTTTVGHQLVQIAGWLGVSYLNEVGVEIPRVGVGT